MINKEQIDALMKEFENIPLCYMDSECTCDLRTHEDCEMCFIAGQAYFKSHMYDLIPLLINKFLNDK